jgi:hypothetical protein
VQSKKKSADRHYAQFVGGMIHSLLPMIGWKD